MGKIDSALEKLTSAPEHTWVLYVKSFQKRSIVRIVKFKLLSTILIEPLVDYIRSMKLSYSRIPTTNNTRVDMVKLILITYRKTNTAPSFDSAMSEYCHLSQPNHCGRSRSFLSRYWLIFKSYHNWRTCIQGCYHL